MTQVTSASALAVKAFSVACFADTQRRPSFRKNMTGPAPKQGDAEKKLKGQTSPDYPFVSVKDLTKMAGDKITVDLFNVINGKPVMGDQRIAGRLMDLTFSSQEIKINQYRAGVNTGGKMTQQRTKHQLRTVAMANLAGYANRLEDQLCLVHVAGARGTDASSDWAVPLSTDADFAEIMVNAVQAPTFNRRYLAGNATGVADLDSSDDLKLSDIDRIRTIIDSMAFPLQGIKLPEDPGADEDPLYVMYVTPEQWHRIRIDATANNNWRHFIAGAKERAEGWKHALFQGSPGMWAGILIKKMNRGIKFAAGASVMQNNAANVESAGVCAVATARAIVLGAQALAYVYGQDQRSEYYMNWHEELTDHGNVREISISMMGGKAKLRFTDPDGNLTDHGVIAIDSYAPAVT